MQSNGDYLREKFDSLQRFVLPKKFQRKIYTVLDGALYRLHKKYRISNEKLLLIAELLGNESDIEDLCNDSRILETLKSSELGDLSKIIAVYAITNGKELKELLSRADISYFLRVYGRTGCMREILDIPNISSQDFEEICKRRGTSDILFYGKGETLRNNIAYTLEQGHDPVQLLLGAFPHLFATKSVLFGELLSTMVSTIPENKYITNNNKEDISLAESDFDSNNCQYSEIAHAKVLFGGKDAQKVFLRGELIGHIKKIGDPTFLSYVDCGILKKGYIYFVDGNENSEDLHLDSIQVIPMRQLSFSPQELDLGISRMVKKHAQMQESDR